MHIPKMRLISALVLVLLPIMLAGAAAQNPSDPFTPGETLTYDVMWTVFRAGQVTATLGTTGQGPHDDYQITATARSEGFVSLLFDVDNVFRATSNPQTLCSEGIVKNVMEGRRHKDTHISFNYARKLAFLDERDLTQPSAPPKHAEFDIPPCVEDVVTAFYYLRRQHLEVGHSIELPVNDGSKTQRVIVEVTPRWRAIMTEQGADWSTRALRDRLLGRWIKVTGWMLFDAEHQNESENTAPGRERNWRATAWEVHPITSIEVVQRPAR